MNENELDICKYLWNEYKYISKGSLILRLKCTYEYAEKIKHEFMSTLTKEEAKNIRTY